MNFTLVQLRYFTETARAGSMTEAARKLHVSQPTLSTAINLLERDLGVVLFERVPRKGIRLTEAGRQFRIDAAGLLAHAEGMAESMGQFAASLTGTLRVGMYLPIAPFRAPTILQTFARRHPKITVELIEGDHEGLLALLQDREIDVAIAYGMVPFEDYDVEVLEVIPPHMLVFPEHPLAGSAEPVSLRSFSADPLVLLDLPHTAPYYLGLFRSLGIEPQVRFRVKGYETVRGLVGSGFGVSLLSQRLAHGLTYSGGRVVPIELTDDLPGMPLCLVRRIGEESPRIEAFSEVCRSLHTAA